jgi:hypothetical protein
LYRLEKLDAEDPVIEPGVDMDADSDMEMDIDVEGDPGELEYIG